MTKEVKADKSQTWLSKHFKYNS